MENTEKGRHSFYDITSEDEQKLADVLRPLCFDDDELLDMISQILKMDFCVHSNIDTLIVGLKNATKYGVSAALISAGRLETTSVDLFCGTVKKFSQTTKSIGIYLKNNALYMVNHVGNGDRFEIREFVIMGYKASQLKRIKENQQQAGNTVLGIFDTEAEADRFLDEHGRTRHFVVHNPETDEYKVLAVNKGDAVPGDDKQWNIVSEEPSRYEADKKLRQILRDISQ